MAVRPDMRRFLFLQGPHGPFFADIARALVSTGAEVRRVLFNRGDRAFWPGNLPHDWFTGLPGQWAGFLDRLCETHGITDLVLYGDTRPHHAAAREAARGRGITVHVFEEGYLRPWWITYERGGANGHSPLTEISMAEILAVTAAAPPERLEAPEGWGAIRRHMAYGAAYHAMVLSGGPRLPSHRDTPVGREALLNARRLVLFPIEALARRHATWRLRRSARPYHLVLLQLSHDSSYRAHSPFPDTETFLDTVFHSFAVGAPGHHQIALKAHPLEDGRLPLRPLIRRLAKRHGILSRVQFIPGGKLGPLLDHAETAVTVNSTAAQQALFRGLPVKAFGEAVYSRPEFVSTQPLPAFFADPMAPDPVAYEGFRQFLLETSQLPGSFYSASGRRQLSRQLPDIMLAPDDRYTRRRAGTRAAASQHLPVTSLRRSGDSGS